MNKQYKLFENILIEIFCKKDIISSITNDSLKCLLFFGELQNDNNNLYEKVIIILLFKYNLSKELISIFTTFIYETESNDNNAIKCFAKVCHLSTSELITKYLKFIKTKKPFKNDDNDELSKLISKFSWNTLNILFNLSDILCSKIGGPPLKKRKLNTNQTRNNYLSIAWLNYLSSKNLEIKIYHLILTQLESHIFKVFKKGSINNIKNSNGSNNNNLILLADFLTDSYNIGGEISLLSLKGLFILINQYNLDYPNFYEKLYQKLHSNIFFSKNSTKFFKLLSLFLLKSDYIPQYLVVAFMKRLSRMSLFAPPNAIIFIVNIIIDLLRKYPAVRFLIDRSKKSNQGLMEAMKIHSNQKLKNNNNNDNDDDDDDDKYDEEELIGNDPFDFNCLDPKQCRANESSLWELKSLINHFEYKTSGHCFQTVTHFKDREYKRVDMNKCHMFEYHKLLNYYFIKNEWFIRNMNNENERNKYGKNGRNKSSEKLKKKRYNVHEISVERSDHLFSSQSMFGDVFSI